MSSQKGNIKKKGPPKHKNEWAYKNDMHDMTQKTKLIKNLTVEGACEKCTNIIEWKIKFKKYKPLNRPGTCQNCRQKNVLRAYYMYCQDCSTNNKLCGKCGLHGEFARQYDSEKLANENLSILEKNLDYLPLRAKKTVLRKLEKGVDADEVIEEFEKKFKITEDDHSSSDRYSDEE